MIIIRFNMKNQLIICLTTMFLIVLSVNLSVSKNQFKHKKYKTNKHKRTQKNNSDDKKLISILAK